MIYTPLTAKAMQVAYCAHHGQVDKGGMPYIFHPYHLAEQMTDELSTCAALLHDVVEDTPVTLEELAEEFPPQVLTALQLLTYDKQKDYFAYLRAIKENPMARAVKLADLVHNSDQSRLAGCPGVSEQQKLRLQEKYRKARAILTEVEDRADLLGKT